MCFRGACHRCCPPEAPWQRAAVEVGARHVTFSRIRNRFSPTPTPFFLLLLFFFSTPFAHSLARATHSRRLFKCHRLSLPAPHRTAARDTTLTSRSQRQWEQPTPHSALHLHLRHLFSVAPGFGKKKENELKKKEKSS